MNETRVFDMECCTDGSESRLDLQETTPTKTIRIFIEEYQGQPGIAEIEILPQKYFLEELPFEEYTGNISKSSKISAGMKIEKLMMDIHFLFAFKIRYEIEQRRARKCGN